MKESERWGVYGNDKGGFDKTYLVLWIFCMLTAILCIILGIGVYFWVW